MSIKYLRVVNSKGVNVISQNFDKVNSFFEEGSDDLEYILTNLYGTLQLNYPPKLNLRLIEEAPNLPEGISAYFFIEDYDLYVFFSTENNLTEYTNIKEITNVIGERKNDRSFYKGVVVADFDDTQGPIPIFNGSHLEEDFLPILAVQGTTVLGMGMTTMPNHIVGPVPIPANAELSTLIRGFQRPAPSSQDPRIQLGGRPTTIFIILESETMLNKETLDFIDTFLTQWIYSDAVKEFFNEEDLLEMSLDLEQLVILAQDLIRLRDIQTSHFKELLKLYMAENTILKQEIAHLKNKLNPNPHKQVKSIKTTKTTTSKSAVKSSTQKKKKTSKV